MFPRYDTEKDELSYPEKYRELKRALIPYHNKVETGALLKSVSDWKSELVSKIGELDGLSNIDESFCELNNLKDSVQRDSIIY